ncbi:MAG: tripartite tricarboxylate transporter substrate binding protein [Clostridia bacterium]|nr:tripartite tricarboxylate transporter substrate binding protein [Clostridia bacterium]
MKKTLCMILALAMALSFATAGLATGYPEKDISGWITYGAGGGTDAASRALAGDMGVELGKTIVMDNMTGASGAVAAQYVLNQPADGYNLLFGSEGVHSFQVMDIADIGIDQFKTVFISCFSCAVLVVPKDSPYNTYDEFIEAAKAAPGTVRMGNTNISGIPYIVSAMMSMAHGTEFNPVFYDSDADAMSALMGGHIDAFLCSHPSVIPYFESGDVKCLMIFHNEGIELLPGVPYVTAAYPEFEKWLPYGPYFGVWVAKDTPDEIVEKLTEAARKSFEGEAFNQYRKAGGAIALGLTGEEANEFMKKMQSNMAYILFDNGAIDTDPASFGIVRNG